jgi:hypothetical protein
MADGRDGRDDAVEKVLRGLRDAPTPEGMEARIAQRLAVAAQDSGTRAAALGWRSFFAGYGQSGVWWRGAVSGAAVAMLAMGAVMLMQHEARGRARQEQRASSGGSVRGGGVVPAAGAEVAVAAQARPCAGPGLLRARRETPAPSGEAVRTASAGRPEPLADAPLTAEERGLVRLVQVADPRELSTLNPEVQEQLEAKEAEEFKSFFPTPPPPKDVDDGDANQPPGS